MLERKITAFGNQTHVENGLDISIRDTFEIIKSDSLKDKILAIRSSKDPTIQSKLKDSLPKVTWNGRFEYRNSSGLIEYSGFTAIDIDLTPGQMGNLQFFKTAYSTDPSVCGIFFTPRWGVKVVYAHDNPDPELHKEMYAQLVEHAKRFIRNHYKIDTSCSDISRVNNLSWDPDIYINPTPIPFHFDPTLVQKKIVNVKKVVSPQPHASICNGFDTEITLEDIDRMTCSCYNMFGQGERHSGLVFFSYRCVQYGIDFNEALLWAIDKFEQPGFDKEEIIKTIESIYKNY
jgi:hypothetical protein